MLSSSSSFFLRRCSWERNTINHVVRNRKEQQINRHEVSIMKSKRRRYIQRQCEVSHQRLMHDYFEEHALFQGYYFRRRFWMHKDLFMCVWMCEWSVWLYRQSSNARGTLGFDPVQKYAIVFHMLAYDTTPYTLDEGF